MENTKQLGGGSSSSSFTMDLFGPKDSSSSSSSTIFGSVFGPASTGLGRDATQSAMMGSMRKQEFGSQYGNAKQGTSENITHRGKGESYGLTNKDKSSVYQGERAEPCYFSSSIYYGGQEVYSPTCQTNVSQHHISKIDGGDDDPNGSNSNSASRGNWWQGSLYY